jgi:hypothetical protein
MSNAGEESDGVVVVGDVGEVEGIQQFKRKRAEQHPATAA